MVPIHRATRLTPINEPARAIAIAEKEVSKLGIVTVGKARKESTVDDVNRISVSEVAVDIEY
jgi:hypothetical protein